MSLVVGLALAAASAATPVEHLPPPVDRRLATTDGRPRSVPGAAGVRSVRRSPAATAVTDGEEKSAGFAIDLGIGGLDDAPFDHLQFEPQGESHE